MAGKDDNDIVIRVTADTTAAKLAIDNLLKQTAALEKALNSLDGKTTRRANKGAAAMASARAAGGGTGGGGASVLLSSTFDSIAGNTRDTVNVLNKILNTLSTMKLNVMRGTGGAAAAGGGAAAGGAATVQAAAQAAAAGVGRPPSVAAGVAAHMAAAKASQKPGKGGYYNLTTGKIGTAEEEKAHWAYIKNLERDEAQKLKEQERIRKSILRNKEKRERQLEKKAEAEHKQLQREAERNWQNYLMRHRISASGKPFDLKDISLQSGTSIFGESAVGAARLESAYDLIKGNNQIAQQRRIRNTMRFNERGEPQFTLDRRAGLVPLQGSDLMQEMDYFETDRAQRRLQAAALRQYRAGIAKSRAFNKLNLQEARATGLMPANFGNESGQFMENAQGRVMLKPGTLTPISRADVRGGWDEYYTRKGAPAAKRASMAAGHSEGSLDNVFRRAAMFGLVSSAIFGAVRAGQQFIGTMINMDKQLADLRKTLGGTDQDFDKLMNSATAIARKYKASTQDVLDSMELFSSQFKRPQDLEALSESAILFSNLSGQGLRTSAETLISTIQQYNMAASDSLKITDAWAAISANTAVTITDLGNGFGSAGAAAVAAGVSFEKLSALIAVTVASTGKSGKEAGNAFKRTFERYTSDENAKKLSKVGINVMKQDGTFRGFEDVMNELSTGIGGDSTKSWDKLTTSMQKQIAVLMSGARQYDAFLAVMNNYNKVLSTTAIAQNSQGEAQRQNARIAETFVKKMQALGVEYDKLARNIGTTLLPILGGLVDMMTSLLKAFNDAPKLIRDTTTALLSAAAAGAIAVKALKWTSTIEGTGAGFAGQIIPRTTLMGRAAGKFISPDGTKMGLFQGIKNLLGAGVGAAGGTVAGNAITGAMATGATAGTVSTTVTAGGVAATGATAVAFSFKAAALAASKLAAMLAGGVAVGYILWRTFAALTGRAGEIFAEGEDKTDAISQLFKDVGDVLTEQGDRRIAEKQRAESLANIGVSIAGVPRRDASGKQILGGLAGEFQKLEQERNRPGISKKEREEVEASIEQLNKNATGTIKDLLKTNPEMMKQFELTFDRFGNIIGLTSQKLAEMGQKIDENSRAIENNSLTQSAKAGITAANTLEAGLRTPNVIGDAYDMGLKDGLITPKGQFKLGDMSLGPDGKPILTNNRTPIDAKNLLGLRTNLLGAGFDLGNISFDDPKVREIFKTSGFGGITQGRQGNKIIDFLAQSFSIQQENQRSFAPRVLELLSNPETAGYGRALEEMLNKTITAGTLFPELYKFSVGELPAIKSEKGVPFDAGKGGRVPRTDYNITRIDLELNKSLVSNQRNFELFGGEVSAAANAIGAYKQALSDLRNSTDKAAGPVEEAALMKIQNRLSLLKQEQSEKQKINKDDTAKIKEQNAKRVVDIQSEIEALTRNQFIIEEKINSERDRGRRALEDQLKIMEAIQMNTEAMRGPIQSAMQNGFRMFGERALGNGGQNILGETGRGTLEAQKIYLNNLRAQIGQRFSMERAANPNMSAAQSRNMDVRERNELRKVDQQIRDITKQQEELNKKTDIWRNLLNDIGNNLLSSITKKLTDSVAENWMMGLFGDSGTGAAPFGQTNPLMNLENIGASLDNFGSTPGKEGLVGMGVLGAGALLPSGELSASGAIDTGLKQLSKDNAALLDATKDNSKVSLEESTTSKLGRGFGQALQGAMVGAALGASLTGMMGREGNAGAIGGGIGGLLGSTVFAAYGGAIWGPLLGGILGSFFDKPISADIPELDELEEPIDELNFSIQELRKSLNTVNETMENLINAPGNFVLPIPKGILENSITAQSAIATPLQAGGLIMKSGPAFLHKGDRVYGVSDTSGGTGGMSVTNSIVIQGANKDPKQIADEVASEVSRRMYNDAQRLGGFNKRY